MSRRAIRCPECDAPQPNPRLRQDGRIACRDCGFRFTAPARGRADPDEKDGGPGMFPWLPVLAGVGALLVVAGVGVAYWAFNRQPDPLVAEGAPPGQPGPGRPGPAAPVKPPAPGPKPSDGKPLVTFPTKVFELAPPPFLKSVEVPLAGVPDDACVGGGGRFVICRIPKRKQLAVLDVCLAKVVKLVPTTDEKTPFAAGMTKLVTYSPSRDEFERWDLETLTKEATVKNRVGGRPERLLMGHLTDGPLYVGGVTVGQDDWGYAFVRPDTFDEVTIKLQGGDGIGPAFRATDGDGPGSKVPHDPRPVLAGDGRLFVWHAPGWSAVRVARLGEDSAVEVPSAWAGTVPPFLGRDYYARPIGAGGILYTAHGPLRADLTKATELDTGNPPGWGGVPATSGTWRVVSSRSGKGPGGSTVEEIHFSSYSARRGVALVPESQLKCGEEVGWYPKDLLLVPEAEVLLLRPPQKDAIRLLRVNPIDHYGAIKTAAITGTPPPAVRGRPWTYAPTVLSAEPAALALVSGPAGMTVVDGLVRWDVPAGFAAGFVNVTVSVPDGKDKTARQSVDVPVVNSFTDPAVIRLPASAGPRPAPQPRPRAVPDFPITLTTVRDGTEVALPGEVDFQALAGGGRFLLLRLPKEKRLAVFDVVRGEVVKELPLPAADTSIAGSRSRVFALDAGGKKLLRWSLDGFAEEAALPVPVVSNPRLVGAAAGTDGPVFVCGMKKLPTEDGDILATIDSADGKEWPLDLVSGRFPGTKQDRTFGYAPVDVSVSPDGSAAVLWAGRDCVFEFTERAVPVTEVTSGRLFGCVAGPGGMMFLHAPYAAGTGPQDDNERATRKQVRTFPASEGPWYLEVTSPSELGNVVRPDGPSTMALRVVGQAAPLADIGPDGFKPPFQKGPLLLPRPQWNADRPFLIPRAEAVFRLTGDRTKLLVSRVDVKKLWEATGTRCAILGTPPSAERRGRSPPNCGRPASRGRWFSCPALRGWSSATAPSAGTCPSG